MAAHLLVAIHLHDRYHGMDLGRAEWPPAPARVFSALVAGSARGNVVAKRTTAALEWLESLPAPVVAAPPARLGRRISLFVPNNDADSLTDPTDIGSIRTRKVVHPRLLEESTLLYVWPIPGEPTAEPSDALAYASEVVAAANDLYQLGRGTDMAWAQAQVIDDNALDDLLTRHRGEIYRPCSGHGGVALACPGPGTLASLQRRYAAFGVRLDRDRARGDGTLLFRQPPRPVLRRVPYACPPARRVFELRAPSVDAAFAPWPLHDVGRFVVSCRDAALNSLTSALPDGTAVVERAIVGRRPDGTNDGPVSGRVRMIPLPSVGHPHADRRIRRLLIEVPGSCPIQVDDVAWAFSGLAPRDPDTGDAYPFVLTPAANDSMLRHFGVHAPSRLWRTVTPAALPEAAARRRIDPVHRAAESKSGPERGMEQSRAAGAVVQALRHADVRVRPETIRVQREPFEGNGERVERFASGTRFSKHRLWHVEIRFAEPILGPLVIGDGRFLGFGVMVPVVEGGHVHVLTIEDGLARDAAPADVTRAARRAVMARVARFRVDQPLAPFFSGHEPDGAPALAESHTHLSFAFDADAARILVIPPHVADRRPARPDEREHLSTLDEAMCGLTDIRAGHAGALRVVPARLETAGDRLFRHSFVWESVTEYVVNRHEKGVGTEAALRKDLEVECRRRGLPLPSVVVIESRGIRGHGLAGRLTLTFPRPVAGPLLLGRSRYRGGGLFAAVE